MSERETLNALRHFVESRDWGQFHSIENLAKSISIEAAELLEVFQWGDELSREKSIEELADVLTYCYLLADKFQVSPEEIILDKLEKTSAKYPVEKSKGISTKYDKL
jgi:NTP pyrophosphatase (non-canonical NTP hydrolase)